MQHGNQCDQTHILHADACNQILISVQSFSCSQKFAASVKSINIAYTYGHDKKQQTGFVIVGFNSDQCIQYCDKVSKIWSLTALISMKLPENYFRQEKYGEVAIYFWRQ